MSGPFPNRSFRWWAGRAILVLRGENGFGSQTDTRTGRRHGRLVVTAGVPRGNRRQHGRNRVDTSQSWR